MRIEPSFWLLLAVVTFADAEGVFAWFLLAAAVHECGHLFAVKLFGGSITEFRLSAAGGNLRYRLPKRTCLRESIIVLSGCIAGVMLAGAAHAFGHSVLCGASLLLTLFNLLPVPPLDGGTALRILFGENRLLELLSAGTCALVVLAGLIVLWRCRGFGLLFIGVLLARARKIR